MKHAKSIAAIILLIAVLTGLPAAAASDDLFCTFDTDDLTLEIESIYMISGIVYSPTLHITEVSIDIYDPSGNVSRNSVSVAGDGESEFDCTDFMEICLSELGVYLIRWTAETAEGVGFSHPVEKRITVVERGGGSTSDGSFEDRAPLGEADGEATGTIGDDTYDRGSFEAPDLIPQPIEDQEEDDGFAGEAADDESADSWFFEDESGDSWLIEAEESPSADIPENSSLTLRTSERGIAFIKAWESCMLYVYDDATNQPWGSDSRGNPTIGYGHKLVQGDGFTTSSTITQEEAEALFLQDLARREAVCDDFLRRTGAVVTQNQYDALSSFFYNGNAYALESESFMYRLFRDNAACIGDIPAWKIYNQFANYYSKANASVRKGLLKRRLDEARIFVDAVYERFDWSIPDWAARGDAVPDEWYPDELRLGTEPLFDDVLEGDAETELLPKTSVFVDVRLDDPCYNAIERMYLRGVISGTGSGSFSPNSTLTRGQSAALLCKLIGCNDLPRKTTDFTDVPKSHWASGYIQYCSDNGLMSGYGNQLFGPDDTLTLKQFCKLLVSLLGEDLRAERLGGWPDGYFKTAKELQLLEGVDYSSDGALMRKYAAAMLDNVFSYQSERLEYTGRFAEPVVGNASDDSVVYVQTDAKWEKDTYGYSDVGGTKVASFYKSACGVFAVVNAVHAVTRHDFTDDEIRELAKFSVNNKDRVDGVGTKLSLVKNYAAKYGETLKFHFGGQYRYISPQKNDEIIKNLNNCLDAGGAFVFSVWSSSGGHLMTIVNRRLNSKGESEYLLLDSYASVNRLGSSAHSGWVTMDEELDLYTTSGNKIRTKGGKDSEEFGFWCIYPNP